MTAPGLKIAPSLLASDFTRLGQQIQELEAGGADWLHIDVMDGRFVPNITMGPFIVEAIRSSTSLPLDVHLMIVEPERYLKAFADAGADSISVHLETSPHIHRTLSAIRDLNCLAGVAINPHTPAAFLSEIMNLLDYINVMTVNPGFGGQKFIPETLAKIAELRAMANDRHRKIDIEVDGGVNTETAPAAVQAGATVLIAGTSVFHHDQGIQAGIQELRDAVMV